MVPCTVADKVRAGILQGLREQVLHFDKTATSCEHLVTALLQCSCHPGDRGNVLGASPHVEFLSAAVSKRIDRGACLIVTVQKDWIHQKDISPFTTAHAQDRISTADCPVCLAHKDYARSAVLAA